MLQIQKISKKYKTENMIQTALNEISLNFRDNEFRESIKDAEEYVNFINCFENISKIFKKKRKKN